MRWFLRFHHGDNATDHPIEEGTTTPLPEIPEGTHSVTLLPETAPPAPEPEPAPAEGPPADAINLPPAESASAESLGPNP